MYVRARKGVAASVKEQCTNTKAKPSQIYTIMVVDAESESACPRNLKQVQKINTAVTADPKSTRHKQSG